jgi:membrane protease YdiL (CAAX protease family)
MSRSAGARQTRVASNAGALAALQRYFHQSELPLICLSFLLPMIVLYEIGTYYFASDWARHTETRVLAFNLLRQFLAMFGATGRYLPCFAVCFILLTWHIARRDPWQVQVGTNFLMCIESALLALPILAIGSMVGRWLPLYTPLSSWRGGVVLALGAGIYEELVFRLMAFTLLNILFVDMLRMDKKWAYLLIVVGSSILFALYHYWSPQSAPFRWSDCIFRTICGGYFGVLFLTRGFGITAGTHAIYDIYFFTARALLA